jgi:acetone carboxylase gamma subunit
MSESLVILEHENRKVISCRKCKCALGPAGVPWKQYASLVERPIQELCKPYTAAEKVMLRNFACPDCGTLLDTEIALEDDPFLDDILL